MLLTWQSRECDCDILALHTYCNSCCSCCSRLGSADSCGNPLLVLLPGWILLPVVCNLQREAGNNLKKKFQVLLTTSHFNSAEQVLEEHGLEGMEKQGLASFKGQAPSSSY